MNGNTLSYNAETRPNGFTPLPGTGLVPEGYVYEGQGKLVKTDSTGTTTHVYDAFDQLATEYSASAASSSCTPCYLSYDHLGSVRLVTDNSGQVLSRHDNLPFGEEIGSNAPGRNSEFAQSDGLSQRFTGKERDQESGLDFFGARYYGSALGRFTSPDPKGIPNEFDNPQAWNKYAYTGNNPLRYTDPDGKDWKDVVAGAFNAFTSDNAFGAGRQTGNSDFRTGQSIGDGVAFVQGGLQALAGTAGDIGGGLATATGVGAAVGVPAIAASTAVAIDGFGVAGTAAKNLITTASATSGNQGPGFVVSPGGDAVPVPEGASGPNPVVNNQGKTTGFSYTGGQGGSGLDPKVTDVRVMDPTQPRGSSPGYPNGYVTYQNKAGQGVNPQTGKTVPNSDPSHRIPLSGCNNGGTPCP